MAFASVSVLFCLLIKYAKTDSSYPYKHAKLPFPLGPTDHGEDVRVVDAALPLRLLVFVVVQHARHRQPEVRAERVYVHGLPDVDGLYVVHSTIFQNGYKY